MNRKLLTGCVFLLLVGVILYVVGTTMIDDAKKELKEQFGEDIEKISSGNYYGYDKSKYDEIEQKAETGENLRDASYVVVVFGIVLGVVGFATNRKYE